MIGFLTQALIEQGDVEEASRIVAQSGIPEQLPTNLHLAWFRLARGQLRNETGDPERGVEELLEVGETVRLVPNDNPTTLPWRSRAVEGLRLLDRPDEAHALAEQEVALARTWGLHTRLVPRCASSAG
jgi:hypothetical protein